jgi:hypothetical protein
VIDPIGCRRRTGLAATLHFEFALPDDPELDRKLLEPR